MPLFDGQLLVGTGSDHITAIIHYGAWYVSKGFLSHDYQDVFQGPFHQKALHLLRRCTPSRCSASASYSLPPDVTGA